MRLRYFRVKANFCHFEICKLGDHFFVQKSCGGSSFFAYRGRQSGHFAPYLCKLVLYFLCALVRRFYFGKLLFNVLSELQYFLRRRSVFALHATDNIKPFFNSVQRFVGIFYAGVTLLADCFRYILATIRKVGKIFDVFLRLGNDIGKLADGVCRLGRKVGCGDCFLAAIQRFYYQF